MCVFVCFGVFCFCLFVCLFFLLLFFLLFLFRFVFAFVLLCFVLFLFCFCFCLFGFFAENVTLLSRNIIKSIPLEPQPLSIKKSAFSM